MYANSCMPTFFMLICKGGVVQICMKCKGRGESKALGNCVCI